MWAPNLQAATAPGPGLPGKQMGVLPAAQLQWGAQAAGFSTDLCDCCDNLSICCKTMFCPCLTFSEIHQHVTGEGAACDYFMLACLLPCTFGSCFWAKLNRSRLRKMYGLSSKGCCAGDCCVHCLCFCCHTCAMCQERREIDFRQHALAATQAMAGNQMILAGGVVAPPSPYPPPPGTITPASSAPSLYLTDSNASNLVTLPSGQVVMMTPVTMAPAPGALVAAPQYAPSPVSPVSPAAGAPSPQFIAK